LVVVHYRYRISSVLGWSRRARTLPRSNRHRRIFPDDLFKINPDSVARIPKLDLARKYTSSRITLFRCAASAEKAFSVSAIHTLIDPIFSFASPSTMREAEFLPRPLVRQYLRASLMIKENPFAEHQMAARKGIDNLET